MATRMTKQSKENLTVADRAELRPFSGGGSDRWAIYLFLGDRLGVVHGGDGFVMLYPSAGAAERAIFRVRSDIRVTITQERAS